jgi:AcrR family transcriptional regulator
MPNSTFFRLPKEKQQRLVDAAWQEFTQTKFSDVSINRIIQNAKIPRGSFYQYFADKDDLFFYLISDIQNYFRDLLDRLLGEAQGNVFQLPVRAYDYFLQDRETPDLILSRCMSVLRLNQGWDVRRLLINKKEHLPEDFRERIRMADLKRQDQDFVEQLFAVLMMLTGSAVAEAMTWPEELERQRALLQMRVELVRTGSAAPDSRALTA